MPLKIDRPPVYPQEIQLNCGGRDLWAGLIYPEKPQNLVVLAYAERIKLKPLLPFLTQIRQDTQVASLFINLSCFSDVPGRETQNVPLMTERLLTWLTWIRRTDWLSQLPCALVGVDESAPVALRATAQRDTQVQALLCHGGLPDQAGRLYLQTLHRPTLLIPDTDNPFSLSSGQRTQIQTRCCTLYNTAQNDCAQTDTLLSAHAYTWLSTHLTGESGSVT